MLFNLRFNSEKSRQTQIHQFDVALQSLLQMRLLCYRLKSFKGLNTRWLLKNTGESFIRHLLLSIFLIIVVGNSHAQKVLRIGYEHLPPLNYTDENGQASGLDVERVKVILDHANIPYVFYEYPWKRVLLKIEKGELDLALAAGATPDRESYAYFSDEVFKTGRSLLYVQESDQLRGMQLNSLSEIKHNEIKIGVRRGASYSDEYEALLQDPNFQQRLVYVADVENGLKLLKNKRISALVTGEEILGYVMKKKCVYMDLREIYNLNKHEGGNSYLMYSKASVELGMVRRIDQSMKEVQPALIYKAGEAEVSKRDCISE